MLAAAAAAGDTGLTMGLLCVLQRVLRYGRLTLNNAANSLVRKVALTCAINDQNADGHGNCKACCNMRKVAPRPKATAPMLMILQRYGRVPGVSWSVVVDVAFICWCVCAFKLLLDCGFGAQAGALTTPLWELSLLTQHYHPRVHSACVELASGNFSSGNGSRLLPLSGSVAAFAASFCTANGAYNPPPTPA